MIACCIIKHSAFLFTFLDWVMMLFNFLQHCAFLSSFYLCGAFQVFHDAFYGLLVSVFLRCDYFISLCVHSLVTVPYVCTHSCAYLACLALCFLHIVYICHLCIGIVCCPLLFCHVGTTLMISVCVHVHHDPFLQCVTCETGHCFHHCHVL